METFKAIEGYEGLYEVSDYGNIKSLRQNKLLKPGLTKGYHKVILHKDDKDINKQVHRLVAEAFIPNPNGYGFVNHIDNNRMNNRVDNLEWCTQKMNSEHAAVQGRVNRGANHGMAKITDEIAREMKYSRESAKHLADKYGVHFNHVYLIKRGKSWKHV